MGKLLDGYNKAKSQLEQKGAEARQRSAHNRSRLLDLEKALREDGAFLAENDILLKTLDEPSAQLQLKKSQKMFGWVNYDATEGYKIFESGKESVSAKDQTDAAEKVGALIFRVLFPEGSVG